MNAFLQNIMSVFQTVMVVDVETPNLMGGNVPLAVAARLYSLDGKLLNEFVGRIDLTAEVLSKQDDWVMTNVIAEITEIKNVFKDETELMLAFAEWYSANKKDAMVMAHMCHPVETLFFAELFRKGFIGMWEQPTFYDVSMLLLINGENPSSVDTYNAKNSLDLSEVSHLKPHHPLYDVVATMVCFMHIINKGSEVELPQGVKMSLILVVNESSVTEKQVNLFVADLLLNKNSCKMDADQDYAQKAVQKFLTLVYGEDRSSIENLDKIEAMVTKCVLAKKGDVLHIKYPERYLHYDKELFMFTTFLISVVERGIEIVLQTNSEILWLQLRIAIKTGVINKDDLITYFINKDGNNPIKITVEQDGGCHNQPRGFFDTIGDQLSELFSF